MNRVPELKIQILLEVELGLNCFKQQAIQNGGIKEDFTDRLLTSIEHLLSEMVEEARFGGFQAGQRNMQEAR